MSTPQDQISAGDKVRLTGTDWEGFGLENEVVTIEYIDAIDGPVFTHNNVEYGVWSDNIEDYSATKED